MSETSATPEAGEPSSEPPLQPEQPIVFEPATWYEGTWTCATNTCVNYNTIWPITNLYSNNGIYVPVQCGRCQTLGTILTAVKMDPQPPEE